MRRLADADEQEDDAAETCPVCGSPDIVPWEWEGGTGVRAPDGYEEQWLERGIKCLRCGAIEED